MTTVLIDAVGIKGQDGGTAILCELLHWLPKVKPDWHWQVVLLPRHMRKFDDPLVPENVEIRYSSLGGGWVGRLFWLALLLPFRARITGADVVLSFANLPLLVSTCPNVVYLHQAKVFSGTGFQSVRTRLLRLTILAGSRRVKNFIVQTRAMANALSGTDSSLANKTIVIPGGCRTASPTDVVSAEFRRRIAGIPHPRIAYVSLPREHKNHEALIRAMVHVVQKTPSASLILTINLDASPHNSRALVERLAKVAQETGLADRIVWLGILSPAQVDYLLRNVDVMVFPSLTESFGLPLAEAISANCPVAAADLPYAHDVAGDAAIYFDPNDPRKISEAITLILNSVDIRKDLCAARAAIRERFSYRLISDQIAAVLETARQERT